MMKQHWSIWIVTVTVAMSQLSCVKLDTVEAYSTASAKPMENKAIINDMPATVVRRVSYRSGGQASLKDAQANAKRLEKVQDTYRKYFLALGALAKKDLTEYKTQFTSFEKAVAESGLVTKSESTAIRKVLQTSTSLGADIYRERKLKSIVEAVDPTLQRGMKELRDLNANYRMSLQREDRESRTAWEESLAAGDALSPPTPPYIANSLRSMQVQKIEDHQQKSDAYDKATFAIARGHKALLRDSRNLRGDEAFKALKPHVEEIVDAYNELTK